MAQRSLILQRDEGRCSITENIDMNLIEVVKFKRRGSLGSGLSPGTPRITPIECSITNGTLQSTPLFDSLVDSWRSPSDPFPFTVPELRHDLLSELHASLFQDPAAFGDRASLPFRYNAHRHAQYHRRYQ